MWKKEREYQIQQLLLQIDPDYRSVIKRGFYYIQMPSRPSRFYMREALAWLQDHSMENEPLLDYGCGVGTFMAFLNAHGFNNITGADVDKQCLDTAQRLFKELGALPNKLQHVEFSDIYNLPRGYKVIFIMDLLYGKAFNLDTILKSAHAALTPGGIFMFDMFDYEGTPNPGRQYHKCWEVAIKYHGLFECISQTTYYAGNSKTLHILRRLPD